MAQATLCYMGTQLPHGKGHGTPPNLSAHVYCVQICDLEKVLGIIKNPSRTGRAQAHATLQLVNLWDVSADIVGMCFDTTASNTGPAFQAGHR